MAGSVGIHARCPQGQAAQCEIFRSRADRQDCICGGYAPGKPWFVVYTDGRTEDGGVTQPY
jgi:hypothetical protein